MLYSIYQSGKEIMEKYETESGEEEKMDFRVQCDLFGNFEMRLETATEISQDEEEKDGHANECRLKLACFQPAPELTDIQMKQDSQTGIRKQSQNPHRVIRTGYLQKRTSSFLNRWQICYCVLTFSKLYCFQDETKINLVSCINFNVLSTDLTREDLTLSLKLHEYEDSICFKSYTQREAEGWSSDIGSIIQFQRHSYKINFIQSKKSIYHQKDAMTQREFLQTAESGDIVLMSTTDTQCAIQRFVTNSEYDHIGMIVNFNGEVKIFEANADEGVNVYNWAQFQTEFHKYEKISVRKLHYHRSNEVQPLLMKFIKSTIGKKYDLGALKLMRRKASSDEEVQNGFFCSELIAKVYKTLGLLSLEKASSNYWPVDFTMRGGINLLDSASLGQQKLIILNKHLKFRS